MRPPLDPLMGEVVLCARIARWRATQFWQPGYVTPDRASEAAKAALRSLPLDYPGMLRFALHSLSIYLGLGMHSSEWLCNVLEAAHLGSSFRRCFFFDYKENRGPYPRVTNRGVQTSDEARNPRKRKVRRNA